MSSTPIFAGLLAAAVLSSSISAPAAEPTASVAPSASVSMATAQAKFGVDMLGSLAGKSPKANILLSPVSLAATLGLLSEGADAGARAAIAETLRLSVNVDPGPAVAAMARAAAQPRADTTVRFGYGLWANQGFELAPGFRRAAEALDAQVAVRPFASPDTLKEINGFFAKVTNGKIDNLITELPVDGHVVLANAMYFFGKWSKPFDSSATVTTTFTDLGQTKQRVRMMRLNDNALPFRSDKALKAVDLDYGSGDIAMTVLLPTESGTANLLKALEAVRRDPTWLTGEGFAPRPGALNLPRFTGKFRVELLDTLKREGLASAFRVDALQGIGKPSPSLTSVVHQVTLSVDEKGSEATAATAAIMGRSAIIARPFDMNCNRPFIVAIHQRSSGAVLLIGLIGHIDRS